MSVISRDVHIPVDRAILAGTLVLPDGKAMTPSLLLISGSGANDRDETVCGHKPFRRIADYFGNLGYASLRYDDRGVGNSTGDSTNQDFESSIADAVAAFEWLQQQPNLDPNRIALLGHSEGGLVAAVVAKQVPVHAVVMLAGPATNIEEMLHEQARLLSIEAGASSCQLMHERQMNELVFAIAMSDDSFESAQTRMEQVIGEFLRTWPDCPPFEESEITTNSRLMASVINSAAYRSLLKQDPNNILRSLHQPVLALYGGKDMQVSGVANAEACKRISVDCPNLQVQLFPCHNHLFQLAGTGSISEYETQPEGPGAVVLETVSNWISTLNS